MRVVATVTAAKMALPLSTENCFLLSLDFATYGLAQTEPVLCCHLQFPSAPAPRAAGAERRDFFLELSVVENLEVRIRDLIL